MQSPSLIEPSGFPLSPAPTRSIRRPAGGGDRSWRLSRVRRSLARFGLPALAGALSLAALGAAGCHSPAPAPDAEVTVRADGTLAFPARVNVAGFEDARRMAGYHAVVFAGGRAADAALLQAEVTDVQVLDALEATGAIPGDTLTMESWTKRNDPDHPAPDQVLEGPPVELLVELPGRPEPLPFAALLDDPGGRGLDLRFGGHRQLIPQWKSGCIVCLYSCPGSKVGNATYTIRDYVRGTTRFTVRPGLLPPDGSEVTVLLRLRLRPQPAAPGPASLEQEAPAEEDQPEDHAEGQPGPGERP